MKHYLYALGAILCWASLPAATGSALDALTSEEIMFFSFSSAAAFLYLQQVGRTRSFTLQLPDAGTTLLGIWGIFIYHYVYYNALDHTPLAEGAILTTTWSFWIVVFSSLLAFRKLTVGILATASLGMFGAALVVSAGKELSFDLANIMGYALSLACGLIWSTFSVAIGRKKTNGDTMTSFTTIAAILSAILYASTGPHPPPSFTSLSAAVYLGCIPLGLSFFFWNRALSGGDMVGIGYLSYMTPPLAVLMVATIHGEPIRAQILVGMAVIIAASIGGRVFLPQQANQE